METALKLCEIRARAEGFRAGQELMRERAAKHAERNCGKQNACGTDGTLGEGIRALQIVEAGKS